MVTPGSLIGHDKPRLIHVTTTDISLDWLLLPQLRVFCESGYEVFGASAPGPHVQAIEAAGIQHLSVSHATRAMDPVSDFRALCELISIFRKWRPDIVHTHNPKPGIYGRLAAQIAGVPIVVNTVHGLYATSDDSPLKRSIVYGLERISSYWSDVNLVQNPEDVETLVSAGHSAEDTLLLGNGVDLERFNPTRFDQSVRARLRDEIGAAPDDVVIGAVGRLVWEKGYRELFDAVTYLRARANNVRFVVVGPVDAAKADSIDAEFLDSARANGVVFLGHRDDVDELYVAMDIYVLASYREGFPRSAMEAAAMGLPIVATDIRGCRQVVTNGVNGFLVPPRNAVALAEALGIIVEDSGLRTAMGVASQARAVREFDQDTVIEITLGVYERLLRARVV